MSKVIRISNDTWVQLAGVAGVSPDEMTPDQARGAIERLLLFDAGLRQTALSPAAMTAALTPFARMAKNLNPELEDEYQVFYLTITAKMLRDAADAIGAKRPQLVRQVAAE